MEKGRLAIYDTFQKDRCRALQPEIPKLSLKRDQCQVRLGAKHKMQHSHISTLEPLTDG